MSFTVSSQPTASFERPAAQSRGGVTIASKVMGTAEFSLAELPIGVTATISSVSKSDLETDRGLIQRLVEIGFVPGEKVKIIAHGHPGREPIAVRIGGTTFALRRFEADYVYVVADD
jgi:ferrous iron transport protein A